MPATVSTFTPAFRARSAAIRAACSARVGVPVGDEPASTFEDALVDLDRVPRDTAGEAIAFSRTRETVAYPLPPDEIEEDPPADPEEEKIMPPEKPTTTIENAATSSAITALLGAFRQGAADGAAAALAHGLASAFLASPIAKRLPAIVTDTDIGRRVLTWVLPPLLVGLTFAVPDAIPRVEVVRAVALRAFRGYTVVFVYATLADLGGFFKSVIDLAGDYSIPNDKNA